MKINKFFAFFVYTFCVCSHNYKTIYRELNGFEFDFY